MRHLARLFVSSLILLPGLARAQMPGSSDLDQFLAQLGLTRQEGLILGVGLVSLYVGYDLLALF